MIGLTLSTLFGADYSSMSIEELQNAKGTVPAEERAAFQAAMREKVQGLSPEERAELGIGKNRFNEDMGQGTTQRLRDGSGSGGSYKGSKGKGSYGGGRK